MPALIVVIVPAAVYSRVPTFDFVTWDDGLHVYQNPNFDPVTLQRFVRLWHGLNPLTQSLYALLALLPVPARPEGLSNVLSPAPFHAANVALHVLVTFVVFRLLQTLARSPWAACGGALLFACHPLQVETVCWVSSLKDVLSGFAALVAVWRYLVYAGVGSRGTAPSHRLLDYGVSTVFFALALLAKSTAVVTPIIAAVLHICFLGRRDARRMLFLLPWVGLAVVWGWFAKAAQPNSVLAFVPPLYGRPFVAADALVFYMIKLVAPFRLAPDYGRTPAMVLGLGWSSRVELVAVLVSLTALLYRVRDPWLLAAAGIFIAGVMPVLGLVPFVHQNYSTVADRYAYLSLLGPALALARLLSGPGGRVRTVAGVGVVGLLALLALRSTAQAQYWRDSFRILGHTLAVNPRSWMAHNNLASAALRQYFFRLERGLGPRGELREAQDHLRASIEIQPRCGECHNNLAIVLFEGGQIEEAIVQWEESLRSHPSAEAYYGLGKASATLGQDEDAMARYREALRLNPDFASAHFNLGNTLTRLGRLQEAVPHFLAVVHLQPRPADAHHNLANIYLQTGQFGEAASHYAEALRIDPSLVEARRGLALAQSAAGRR